MFRLGVVLLLVLSSTWAQEDPPDYDWDTPTALDDYVNFDDGYWTYELLDTYPLQDLTMYILNMTSQNWIGADWVDRHIWWHYMAIVVPDEIRDTTAGVLAIVGGDNMNPPPTEDDLVIQMLIAFANATDTVSGVVMQVPNQPSVFANDPDQKSRREDSLIAWTWRTAIDDPEQRSDWVARLPFTKAAKRGLDTIHDFTQSVRPETDITRFGVTGASKRGWTAWSLAATDLRIIGALPMVFDGLNAPVAFMDHYRALGGGWSWAFEPYYVEDLTYHILDDDLDYIYDVEDSAIPALTRLPLVTSLQDIPIPDVTWTRSEDLDNEIGTISLNTDILPAQDDEEEYLVRGLRAETLANDTKRDYRLLAGYPPGVHPVFWFSQGQEVTHDGDGNFEYIADMVEGEWVGHFIELEFEGPEGYALFMTSEVNIIPDTFPVEPCETPEECYGFLT